MWSFSLNAVFKKERKKKANIYIYNTRKHRKKKKKYNTKKNRLLEIDLVLINTIQIYKLYEHSILYINTIVLMSYIKYYILMYFFYTIYYY